MKIIQKAWGGGSELHKLGEKFLPYSPMFCGVHGDASSAPHPFIWWEQKLRKQHIHPTPQGFHSFMEYVVFQIYTIYLTVIIWPQESTRTTAEETAVVHFKVYWLRT